MANFGDEVRPITCELFWDTATAPSAAQEYFGGSQEALGSTSQSMQVQHHSLALGVHQIHWGITCFGFGGQDKRRSCLAIVQGP